MLNLALRSLHPHCKRNLILRWVRWGPLALAWALSLLLSNPAPAWAATTQLTWRELPGASSDAYARATQPDQMRFPQDFGPHEDFQTEWWYYTGNLETEAGRPFGYQLTFFRSAVAPEATLPAATTGTSAWRSHQLYSAHFTLSDIEGDRFYPYERYSRSGAGLAGAAAQPYTVWLDDWSATEIDPEIGPEVNPGINPEIKSNRSLKDNKAAGQALGKVRLRAQAEGTAIDLVLEQTLPPILQGDRGLSQKGAEPGNASYYYSLVQQPTAGTIILGDRTYPVRGSSWKDHEYSTSSLSQGTVGWDWFSLQFDNGTALMLYGLRHEDGSFEPTSAGKFVRADASTEPLALGDFEIQVRDTWKSPRSKAVYPAAWAIAIPKLQLQLQGQAQLADQELNTATATYWEGSVAFSGSLQGDAIRAEGYAELTGYADRLDAILGGTSR